MATQNSKKEIVDARNAPTTIGVLDGHFDYPSSRGLGVDVVSYLRRNPHPQEHDPLPVQVKMRDLPGLIVQDLTDAAGKGELREELGRHIALLQENHFADEGSIQLLRGYQRELTGHAGCDRDSLDLIKTVVLTLGPKAAL